MIGVVGRARESELYPNYPNHPNYPNSLGMFQTKANTFYYYCREQYSKSNLLNLKLVSLNQ